YNVSAELSISDPYISITTATNSFGDISINSTRQSAGDYGFDVLPDCPEKDVTFTLEITSDEGSWTDQFTIHVNIDIPPAPEIEYLSHQIDDNTTSGDGDGLVEQGETIKMPITLNNIGDESAHNVVAVLSASDVAISVVSDSHSFYDITAGGSAQSSGYYTFEVEEDCPEKDIAFTLEITSDEGSWTDQFLLHVNHQVTSISKYSFNSELNLYPNPAKDAIFLKSDLEFNSQIEIRIMDSMGRTVYLQIYPSLMKGDIIEIDLSDYHNGMYFFQFNHLDLRKTKKIIKE
ncbi:MAG: T9SS type A sorting domain-containing protein, partial [Bacteroidales bacterium]|nr:T9SS type A sorting domain-containing protein [Bacteroidales bacterium]